MDIGNAIREIRVKKGLKQKELAEKCGISFNAMNNIELNKVSPRNETLENICKALCVSVAYVMVSAIEEKDVPESNVPVFKAMASVKELLVC